MRKTKILAFALAVIMVFSMVSVFASAAYTPTANADVKALVDAKGGIVRQLKNFETGETLAAPNVVDGNNNQYSTFAYIFTDEGVALLGNTDVKNRVNAYTTYENGEGSILRFVQYPGTKKQITYKDVHFEETSTKNVTIVGNVSADYKIGKAVYINANKDAVVEKGTEGAIPAVLYENSSYNSSTDKTTLKLVLGETYVTYDPNTKVVTPADKDTPGAVLMAVRSDDNNNCFQKYIGNDAATSLVNYGYVVSLNFKYTGVADVTQLIGPTFHGSSPGGGGTVAASLRASDDALLVAGNPVATLDTNRFYEITMLMYLKETGEDLYSLVIDVYLDGILVYSGPYFAAYTDKEMSVFTANTFRYHFIAKTVTAYYSTDSTETRDVIYVKNLQDYIINASAIDDCRNYVNSGNTVEGYDLTLGSNLELNYYMNLLPDVKADADAKVQFTIGEEVVAEKKVSEVTPDAKGIYKFTCPVNSTQMATDIKMSIVSGEKTFNLFNNGASSTEHTYKVTDYAKTVLAGEFSAETKTLVKAMLNYGAMAQTYFAEKNGAIAGTLANADCAYTEVELNAANFGTGTVTGATEGMTATLVLDTDTVIKIYKDGALVGESEGITADKLDEDVEIGTVKVSVLTLAGKVPAEKTNFKNLAKALALYSQATEAYKAAQ